MTDRHPHDLDLLAYVEDELDGASERAVSEHVAACADCAAGVRELEVARAALRAAPALELPSERRERLAAELARHDRRENRERRLSLSPARLVAVLAPVAVVAAAVVGVATLVRESVDTGAEDAPVEALEDRAPERAEEGGAAAEEDIYASPSATGPVGSVEGPAPDVAELLRERGLDARVENGRVLVRGAEASDVIRALRDRPPGSVRVVVE